MQREIKLRAWDKKSKVMVDLDGFKYVGKAHIQLFYRDEDDCSATCTSLLENIEIMQYTGSQDKNGKKICESDIVIYPDASPCGDSGEWDCFTNTGVVDYDEETISFYFTERVSIEMDEIDINTEVEVIGNFYENPELLEVSE